MTMNKNDPQVEERKDLSYDASRKQKSSEKTARIPIKIVPLALEAKVAALEKS
jgi:lipoic acid synthetase